MGLIPHEGRVGKRSFLMRLLPARPPGVSNHEDAMPRKPKAVLTPPPLQAVDDGIQWCIDSARQSDYPAYITAIDSVRGIITNAEDGSQVSKAFASEPEPVRVALDNLCGIICDSRGAYVMRRHATIAELNRIQQVIRKHLDFDQTEYEQAVFLNQLYESGEPWASIHDKANLKFRTAWKWDPNGVWVKLHRRHFKQGR